jgi:hypothetical protein
VAAAREEGDSGAAAREEGAAAREEVAAAREEVAAAREEVAAARDEEEAAVAKILHHLNSPQRRGIGSAYVSANHI